MRKGDPEFLPPLVLYRMTFDSAINLVSLTEMVCRRFETTRGSSALADIGKINGYPC